MTPDAKVLLADLAARLGQVVAADLKTPYLVGSTSLMAALLGMAAEEWDRAAARLVQENRAIRALFGQALDLSPPPNLNLSALGRSTDDDLRISALEAANRRLRAALIGLHAWIEQRSDAGAKALEAAIWAELAKSTERRRFANTPF